MLIGLIGTTSTADFAASYFEQHFNFRHFQFLDHVKMLCEYLYNFSFNDKQACDRVPGLTKSPTEILAQVDHFLRNIQPFVFQQNLKVNLFENVVVSDVFYFEDVQRIKELNGFTIRLREKKSKTQIAPFLCTDYVIEFDDLINLQERCDEIYQSISRKENLVFLFKKLASDEIF